MNAKRAFLLSVCSLIVLILIGAKTPGQIVINELVINERTATSGTVTPDTREFVELYNAGVTPVDISGWTLGTVNLANGAPDLSDTIPSGSTIAPGGYFVIGAAGVPNVNYTPASGEIWTDNAARIMELRDNLGNLIDAVAYEVFRTAGTRLTMATAEQLAQIGSGFQGQLISMNAISPNVSASWGRYLDGRDTNSNGRDFGFAPLTPGASNNLPQNPSHTIPDVDSLANGTPLAEYHASFVLPRVVDPTVADAVNPRAIPASPQGGKAIVAWDESGGGNVVYSKELVNKFDLYAYFDTTPIGVAPTTADQEWETSVYGIGSADPFFANPDPTGGIPAFPTAAGVVTANSSTGIGWMYQQFEDGRATPAPSFSKLMLIDFGDGGNSDPTTSGEWVILQEIDMSSVPSGWYRLGIEYDPATGAVTATFGDQTFNHTTATGLVGTFFVGYREGITGATSLRFELHNPPIFDLFVEAGLAGDYNEDGEVDAADYILWRKNPASFGGDPAGYNTWRANFGAGMGGARATQATGAVPEPASLLWIGLALCCCSSIARGTRRSLPKET